jgi:hypothetical protein
MSKVILILFSLLSFGALYATYAGVGLQEVVSEHKKAQHSHYIRTNSFHSYSNGGWSYGK